MNIQAAAQQAQAKGLVKTAEQQKNMMLKLLAVQMENQNPLKPMDSSKVGQQLAAFASVEQQQMTNQLLKTLITSVQNITASSPQSFVGKTAQVVSNTAELDSKGFGKWVYRVPVGSKSAVLRITDASGKELMRRTVTNLAPGDNRVNWKGPVGKDGKPIPGTFKLEVMAHNAQGVVSKVQNINSIGTITKAVVDKKGGFLFEVNGKLFAKSAIKFRG